MVPDLVKDTRALTPLLRYYILFSITQGLYDVRLPTLNCLMVSRHILGRQNHSHRERPSCQAITQFRTASSSEAAPPPHLVEVFPSSMSSLIGGFLRYLA
jgi:hypothetical protein